MLTQVVADALAADPVQARDAATAELAMTYAAGIDAGGDLTKLGPALLVCLEALHMSPRARTAAKKAVTDGTTTAAPNRLDALADRRARRSRAADRDATGTGPV